MFDPLLRREGAGRAARRVGWLAASTAFHLALLAAIGSVPLLVVNVPAEPAIEVKFVKGQPMAPRPAAPPPPPPSRPPPRERPRAEPKPVAPLVQPKELPEELPHPHPEELAAEVDSGDEGEESVVGGIPGGSLAAAPAPSPEGPVPFDAATMTRPIFLSGPAPGYTRRALERNVEGTMVVECVVTVEGLVRQCRVVEGLPFMNEAVVAALEQRRYQPGTRGGKPIAVRYPFRITLKLPRE